MSTILTIAVVFIVAACVLYTVGVWAEKLQNKLEWWHVVVFWLGLICDTIGTGAMGEIAGGLFKSTFHGVTGVSAILLMLFHAIWATIVMAKKQENMKVKFHKFSLVVWLIWLIPMLTGMIFGSNI